jgi:hypothetical protein
VADIQISIRELLADGTQPTTLIFTNKTVPTAVDYAVELANLIPEGLSEEITSLVDQLTACYAVPVTTRASGNQVVAPACTALFYNGNSTTYLNSGNTVSPTGSFSGIFAADATGATFSEGTYLYSRTIALPGGGSATAPVVRIKVVGPSGNTSYFVATLVAQDGSLVLLGDQYAYSGSVAGLSQQRLYINESAASFVSTGLSYNVNNQTTTSNGVTTSIFNRIVVTVAGTSHGASASERLSQFDQHRAAFQYVSVRCDDCRQRFAEHIYIFAGLCESGLDRFSDRGSTGSDGGRIPILSGGEHLKCSGCDPILSN